MVRYDAFYLGSIVGTDRHIVIDMCNFTMIEIQDLCRGIATRNPRFKFTYKDDEKGEAGDIRFINVVYNTKRKDVEPRNGIKIEKYYKFKPMGGGRFVADKREPMVLGKICNKLITFVPGFAVANYRLAPSITTITNSIGRFVLTDASEMYAIKNWAKPLNVKLVMAKDKTVYAQSYLGGIYEYFGTALEILATKGVKSNNLGLAKHIIDSAASLAYCSDEENKLKWHGILKFIKGMNNVIGTSEKADKNYCNIFTKLVESLLEEEKDKCFLNPDYVTSLLKQINELAGDDKIKAAEPAKIIKRESYNTSVISSEHKKVFDNLKMFEAGVKSIMRSSKYTVESAETSIDLSESSLNDKDKPLGTIELEFVGDVLDRFKSDISAYYSDNGLKLSIKIMTVEKDPMEVGKVKTIELENMQLNNLDYAKIAGQHAAKYFAEQMDKYKLASGYCGKH